MKIILSEYQKLLIAEAMKATTIEIAKKDKDDKVISPDEFNENWVITNIIFG